LKGPRVPAPLLNATEEQSKVDAQCGPYMQVYLSSGLRGLGKEAGGEQLDMTLTDIGPYLRAYAESRAALQAQPSGDSNQAGERPGTALSIKF
jgi:hypothetical protein